MPTAENKKNVVEVIKKECQKRTHKTTSKSKSSCTYVTASNWSVEKKRKEKDEARKKGHEKY